MRQQKSAINHLPYSDIPHCISYADQQAAIRGGETEARFLQGDNQYFLLLSTPLRGMDRPLWLVSSYDVTSLFRERDRQLRQHLLFQAAAMLLTGAAAALVSRMMTRSLKQLEAASSALSEGKTGTRVDITSRDELEQLGRTFNNMAGALEQQIGLLQEESERQKRFVAAFTHELKTPMTAILGYAGLMRSAELPPERRRKAADYIYRESARLEALSRELLLLLGLEKGEICLQPVAVTAVYEDVCRSLPERAFRLAWQGEDTLRELETAGVLPAACLAEADTIRDLPDAIAYIGREDGFVQKSYLGHVQTQTGPSKSIVIQQQEETGLVVACTMDAEGSADISALLSAYRSYLGLDGLTDWQTLQTETGAACWSCEGQLYLYCSFGSGRFALGAVSMDEETLKAVAAGLS